MKKFLLLFIVSIGFSIILHAQDKLTKGEKKLVRLYKKYNDKYRLGEFYIEHGMVAEGTALFKEHIAENKGNSEYLEAKLTDLLYKSALPKDLLTLYYVAEYNLKNADSLQSAVATLRALDARGDFALASNGLSYAFYNMKIHESKREMDSVIYYMERAALLGYEPSMFNVAQYYQYADGYTSRPPRQYAYLVNRTKARYWYNQCALKGNKEAADKIAILDKGETPGAFAKGMAAYNAGNYKEAFEWWRADAEINYNATASFNIATLYQGNKIQGRMNNMDEAEGWFESAGDCGMAEGYFWKGKLLWKEGYGKNAMEYFQKAADMGYKEGLTEKQKIQDYTNAVIADRERYAAEYYEKMKQQNNNSNSGNSLNNSKGPSTPKTTTCSSCHGSGTVHTTFYGGAKGPGGSTVYGENRTCSACNGRGFY